MSSTQEVGEIFGEGSGPAHAMLRSPTVLIASVGLWGMNVYFFRLFGINYVRVLKYDLIVLENEDYERQVKAHEKQQHHQQQIEMRERNGSGGSNSSGGSGGGSSNNPGEIRSSAHGVGNSSSSEQTASSSSTGAHSRGGSLKVERLASNPSMLKAAADTLAAAVAGVRSPPGDSDGGPGGGGGSCVDPKKVTPTSAGANGSSKIRDGKPLLQSDRDPYSSDDEDLLNEDSNNNGDGSSGETPRYAAVTWERLVVLSLSLLFLLHSTYYMWIDVLGGGQLGAVFAFYLAVVVAIAFPLPTTRWLRKATVLVLQRSFELINPRCSCVSPDPTYGPRPIPFVDVFFADAMCSLSKVFFDWGMLLHMASHYPDPVPPAAHNILMPSAFAAMPFCIRARQCLLMYNVGRLKCDPKRFSHLWNALKYATSIFPLLLSAYQKTIDPKRAEGLEAYLIILITINAAYALYWDIVMDWGMMQNPTAACIGVYNPMEQGSRRSCGHTLMRPRLRFGVAMSAVIVIADCVLRFSWLLRFFDKKLFPSHDSFVLCTQFLEVFRRAIWNLLRVEWEQLKQIKAPGAGAVPKKPESAAKNEEELTSFLPAPPSGKEKG